MRTDRKVAGTTLVVLLLLSLLSQLFAEAVVRYRCSRRCRGVFQLVELICTANDTQVVKSHENLHTLRQQCCDIIQRARNHTPLISLLPTIRGCVSWQYFTHGAI